MNMEKRVDIVLDEMYTGGSRNAIAKRQGVTTTDVAAVQNSDDWGDIRRIAIAEIVRSRLPNFEDKIKILQAEQAKAAAAEIAEDDEE